MSQVFSKGRILRALAGGPLTWRLLAAEMGFAMAREAHMRSQLWRLWNHEEYVRVTEDGDDLRCALSDMVGLGLVVLLGGEDGPWAVAPKDDAERTAQEVVRAAFTD